MTARPVYLDYNATTPVDPRVLEAMMPALTHAFGNPSSETHVFGRQAKDMVETARGQVADLIGASAREIVFTSGATESCNLAIKGGARMYRDRGNHIVVSAVEHKAVLEPCRRLEQEGFALTVLRPDSFGGISAQQVSDALTPQTMLVCVMMANNVVGTVNPVEEIGQLCRKRGVLFFCDATQAVGKLTVSIERVHADLLALSSHKIYGPKGAGALYVRAKNPRVRLAAQIDGGGQERFLRSGTPNVPGIVGFGTACSLCQEALAGGAALPCELRDRLEKGLLAAIPDAQVHGRPTQRLPNTLSISFKGVDAASMLARIPDLAASAGSACESGTSGANYVLRAMGVGDDLAGGMVRFSLGRFTTGQEIDYAIEQAARRVCELRAKGS
ncbi:MAG TPA: cysteine desulfurase family protein [Sedimentisphaerales bacterium]|jgi:cysteine desulfurase|nr:cysteine desulfurase family protein [Sedimentisphaerales bacterium]HNU29190.1 cysteine desulfurase family protein [Sedimentisphaerales bacterium]